jgi:hypothetical protein
MSDSLTASLRALSEFVEKHEGQWLDADVARRAEELDARIETGCRFRGIELPPRRSPPPERAIGYFGCTQLPFWRESGRGLLFLDEGSDEAKPPKRMFDPDEVWHETIRRLLDLAKEKARLTQSAPSKGRPGRRGYSLAALAYAQELRRDNPGMKAQEILGMCRKKFGEDNLPPDADAFRSWLNRKRTNRTN